MCGVRHDHLCPLLQLILRPVEGACNQTAQVLAMGSGSRLKRHPAHSRYLRKQSLEMKHEGEYSLAGGLVVLRMELPQLRCRNGQRRGLWIVLHRPTPERI